jgi:hypothetical protein
MTKDKSHLAVIRPRRQFPSGNNSSNKFLKTALWFVWLPIVCVLWVVLLDTSYDWVSSPDTTKVIAGLLILILIGCAILALVATGVRKFWTR